VSKLARERDEALVEIARLRTELGGPRVSLSPQPPQVESRRTGTPVGQLAAPLVGPASTRSAASADSSLRRKTPPLPDAKLELDQAEMDAALKGADAGTDIPRLSPPPEELRAALTGVHFPPLNVEPPRSPLKQKPDPSTRPLIGYSLGADSIRPERLEGVALSSKPPSGSRK
jgi:hypothetical protein